MPTLPQPVLTKFSLVILKPYTVPYWREDAGTTWINESGGFVYKSSGDQVLETVEAECYEDLDHSKTGYLVPDSSAGWLSPEGKFYGCHIWEHEAVARLIIKKSTVDMEREGWIHVSGPRTTLFCHRHPTDAQRQWALDHGHQIAGD